MKDTCQARWSLQGHAFFLLLVHLLNRACNINKSLWKRREEEAGGRGGEKGEKINANL